MMLNKSELGHKIGKTIDEIIVGFTASTFDLFHAGHVVMLEEAKTKCDYLIVGLLTDPTNDRADSKHKPIQSVFERYVQVSSCKYVDEVIPFESEKDLIDMILTINPDIRIVGKEYEGHEHTGYNLSEIYYNDRRHSFSSSELRARISDGEVNKCKGNL